MRALLRLMKPDNFEDISAVGALYRPGPMGANSAHQLRAAQEQAAGGRLTSTPSSPRRSSPSSARRYGLIVYQEQVMADRPEARRLHARQGRPAAPGDGQEEDARCSTPSTSASRPGMVAARLQRRPRSRRCGTSWSRSRTTPSTRRTRAAYGLVSYWTAYLKANYPAEYMAALLTSVRDDKDKSALYLNECRRMGIKVLPPDVNESSANFTAVGTDIRFGLAAIRNVGANVVDGIVAARAGQGPLHLVQGLPAQGAGRGLQQAHHRVAGQGRRVRRPAAHPAGPGAGARGLRRRRSSTIKRKEAIGQDSLFGGFGDDADGATRSTSRCCRRSRRSSGTSRRCWPSSARCSASTSPTTRCSASSTSWPSTPTPRSPR